MQIQTQQLRPGQELRFDFKLGVEYIQECLHTQRDVDEHLFSQDVNVHIEAQKISSDIQIKGYFHADLTPVCSRCAETYSQALEKDYFFLLSPYPHRHHSKGVFELEEEDGIYYFSDPMIDIAPLIREHLFLNLPMQYLCSENCQGLCLHCGDNLNVGKHHCKKSPNPIQAPSASKEADV
ncbi:MAG: DUF177 domain-containing protein [Bdellovibrionota bacterium]